MRSFMSAVRSTVRGPLLVLAFLTLRGSVHAEERARPPAVKLPAPENLSAAARAEVRERMSRHGNTMSNLVRALVLLDRPTIAILAGRIADEEVVARVEGGGPDKLKSLLPKEFFAEQDALRNNARDLASAASHGGSDSDLADRFASVAKTCVTCHGVYLRSGFHPVR